MSNGRINIFHPDPTSLFQLYDKIPSKQTISNYRNPTEGLWTDTTLSKTFFSAQNIEYLQEMIIHGVLQKSNHQIKIGYQDEDQLKTIMRGIYLESAQNAEGHIKSQVHELNKKVLAYAVPQVYSAAISYKKYLYDVSTMYKPMAHPILSKKNKQLEFKNWF